MSGEVATVKLAEVATTRPPAHVLANRDNLDLRQVIKDRYLPAGAGDADLQNLIETARALDLDVLMRQIILLPTYNAKLGREVFQPMPTADGARVIANRTGLWDGMDGPYFCGPDGKWVEVWARQEPPFAAKVVIYKKGCTRGFPATARWSAYAPYKNGKLTGWWAKDGPHMLGKCALVLGLRTALPHDLSGVYFAEEMEQASQVAETRQAARQSDAPPPARQPDPEPAEGNYEGDDYEGGPPVNPERQGLIDQLDMALQRRHKDYHADDPEWIGWFAHKLRNPRIKSLGDMRDVDIECAINMLKNLKA